MGYGTTLEKYAVAPPQPSVLVPTDALVISRMDRSDTTVLTQHCIRMGKLDEGVVVGAQQVPEVLRALGLSGGIEWVDDSVLASGMGGIIWYQKPCIRAMHWMLNSKSQSLRVRWPMLLFCMTYAGQFQVWAAPGSRRPNATTPLYHAPLGNIYQDATMCWGSVRVPAFRSDCRKQFEDAVYDTFFTKPNHDQAVRSGGDLFAVWKKAGLKGLMTAQFAPLNKTLGDVIRDF